MTDDLLTRLNDELAPSDDVLARIQARVVADLAIEPAAARGARATASPRRKPRRRVPVIRFGVALAGAAAVALVVALSPFESSTDGPGVPAPAAAQAALERAAVGAASELWRPLGAGEYHHTMSVSIDPEIPRHPLDPEHLHDDSGPPGNASATETLLDRDGHGLEIRTMGGTGDPETIPFVTTDPQGRPSGMGFSGDGVAENTPVGSVDEQLRYAYSVSTRTWPRGERPRTTHWIRQRGGFIEGSSFGGGAIPKPGLTLGQRFQRDLWGAPLGTIDQLNAASPAELPALLDDVLAPTPDGELAISGPLVDAPGYDETRSWFAAQVEVHNAVTLLARAPLSPEVRSTIFRRLAESGHVSVRRDARDADGRRGTRITFEWILDERVPAFTMTKEDLRADAIAKQQPADGDITGPDRVEVPEHDSVGRWYQSIIVDESTGTILQDESWIDWKTTVDVPRVATTTRRATPVNGIGWNVGIRFEPGTYGGGSGELFLVRQRAAGLDEVRSPACEITPRMCR